MQSLTNAITPTTAPHRTVVAVLPYSLLHAAAQFARRDPAKCVISTIRIRAVVINGEPMAELCATDGHRCFRVRLEQTEHVTACCDAMREAADTGAEFLIAAEPLRKRVTGAVTATVYSDHWVELTGADGRPMGAIPASHDYQDAAFPNITQLWPDTFGHNAEPPIAFNAKYLSEFCAIVKKMGTNRTVRMFRNGPHTPAIFAADVDVTGQDYPALVECLIMPVQIRG